MYKKSVLNLDRKLDELYRDMFRRCFHNSLVMARLWEYMDVIVNISKEDKLMISGMTSRGLRPIGKEEIGN